MSANSAIAISTYEKKHSVGTVLVICELKETPLKYCFTCWKYSHLETFTKEKVIS